MSRVHSHIILGLIAILVAGCLGPETITTQLPEEIPENIIETETNPTQLSPVSPESSSGTISNPTKLPQVSNENSSGSFNGWQATSPESQGMDSNTLVELFPEIEEQGTELHSLMIWRNGSTVLEAYFYPHAVDRKHVMFSVTKSFMATLTGIVKGRGYIDSVDQKIFELLPEKNYDNSDPRKEQIRLEDVLTMTSGLGWEESDHTFADMYIREDWVEYVLDMKMVANPGSQFSYCSGCSHILSAVILATTGQDLLAFARENLFEPLAITDFTWETDQSGLPIGGWGLELTTRDMAKLGILYLQKGNWNGEQILPAEWIDSAVEFHTDTGGGVGYGYQWWIFPEYGAYAALGRGGQTVFVIPDQELIIATTAETTNHDPIIDLIDRIILPAIRSDQALPANPEGERKLQAFVELSAQP